MGQKIKKQKRTINSLPNDKFLDTPKLKAITDDQINVTEKLSFLLERIVNIVRNGENVGYQHFLHFPQCFQKAYFAVSLKLVIML